MMIVSTVLVLLVTTLILYTLYILYVRRKVSHIKSPPLKGILHFIPGHAHDMSEFQERNPENTYSDYLRECFDKLGDMTLVLYAYHTMEIWTIDTGIASTILSDKANNFPKSRFGSGFAENFCGIRFIGKHNIVLDSGGEIWHTKRKIMDTAFHRNSMKQSHDEMQAIVNNTMMLLDKARKDGEILNIYEFILVSSLETITRIGFSVDEDIRETGLDRKMGEIFDGLGRFFKGDLSFLLPWSSRSVKENIYQGIRSIRENRLKHLTKRIENAEDMKNKNDILSYIIKANLSVEGFNVEEIIDDFFVFTLAGSETVSSSISFFILVMLQHPEIFAKVREEVDLVYNGRTDLEYEDLDKLVFLEQCIRESLRHYTPLEDAFREAVEDTTINGFYLPKGIQINISQSLIQRAPEYWGPDADKYNPENFASNKTIKPFTYMPFMAGKRNCIGKYFAMMEMKIFLSKFILSFDFYNPNLRSKKRLACKAGVTQRPLIGVPVILTRR